MTQPAHPGRPPGGCAIPQLGIRSRERRHSMTGGRRRSPGISSSGFRFEQEAVATALRGPTIKTSRGDRRVDATVADEQSYNAGRSAIVIKGSDAAVIGSRSYSSFRRISILMVARTHHRLPLPVPGGSAAAVKQRFLLFTEFAPGAAGRRFGDRILPRRGGSTPR